MLRRYVGFFWTAPSEACQSWVALEAFDVVLLIDGDFVEQGQTGIQAQMGDGREGRIFDLWLEVEFADDPAFIVRVADPCDGGLGLRSLCRRSGVAACPAISGSGLAEAAERRSALRSGVR